MVSGSGIMQDARHRRYRCSRPTQVAMTIAAREIKATLVQDAHDLGDGAEFQEGLEHKPKPLLYLDVGILEDDPARVAHQTDRKHEREFAALGLGKQSGSQPAADRVQFKLGYRPLQTEEQATVRAAGIVNAIAIGNEAAAQTTNIQQRIPVGAIAGETRHVDRQDKSNLAEPAPADQFLEAAAWRSRSAAPADISIDHVDVGVMPAELASALPERVLQPQALLIAHNLVRRRLADVNHRFARQMGWCDKLRFHD